MIIVHFRSQVLGSGLVVLVQEKFQSPLMIGESEGVGWGIYD